MPSNLLNISEAKLWDNLKRSANKYLREIAKHEGQSRLNKFDPLKYPDEIEKLLVVIGKSFFKIFLYEVLRNQTSVRSIVREISRFKFYFWPGYTTLSKERIFITGKKKDNDQKYFTGIGNYPITIQDKYLDESGIIPDNLASKFLLDLHSYFNDDFFTKNRTKRDFNNDVKKNSTLFKTFKNKFWVFDIPSTFSFDAVLNQYYLDENIQFVVPSTHHWKSSQLIVDDYNNQRFMPMPLSTDGSELRILDVSLGRKGGTVGQNMYSIVLKSHNADKLGSSLAYFLSKDRIPILFQENSRVDYKEWPYFKSESIKEPHLSQINRNLGIESYSYWIANTLKFPSKKRKKSLVDHVKRCFEQNNLVEMSERIKSSESKIRELNTTLENHYFKHWTTIFLESFSGEMDLGSLMFLTSHTYSPQFHMRCSNWIRWIYNELRILESTAKEEVETREETEEEDFGKLAHNTKLFFPYLRSLVNSISNSNAKNLIPVIISELESFENIVKVTFYSFNLDLFKEHYPPTPINLNKVIDRLIAILKYDIVHNEGQVIKLTADKDFQKCIRNAIDNKTDPLFDIALFEEHIVLGNEGPLILILKDLIGNAVKYSTSELEPGKPLPKVKIKSAEDHEFISLEITNSLGINDDAVVIWKTGQIPKGSPLNLCFGLKIASTYCKIFDIRKDIEVDKVENKTTFKLQFRKWKK